MLNNIRGVASCLNSLQCCLGIGRFSDCSYSIRQVKRYFWCSDGGQNRFRHWCEFLRRLIVVSSDGTKRIQNQVRQVSVKTFLYKLSVTWILAIQRTSERPFPARNIGSTNGNFVKKLFLDVPMCWMKKIPHFAMKCLHLNLSQF